MLNVVHVTHEAVQKIGGIGAVLDGLITSQEYAEAIGHTILLCPLFSTHGGVDDRLGAEGEVLYSSLDGRVQHALAPSFREIEQRYHVEIVYGRRLVRDPLTGFEQRPEVILIDVSRMNQHEVNGFKHRLFESFGLASTRYEHSWDYEQYTRLAEPGLAAIRAISGGLGDWVIVAHEFMGVPTALAARMQPAWGMKTAYYSHEVPAIRKIVEEHPGHDTMFYNIMRLAEDEGRFVTEVFGDQFNYFRHALVDATRHLDVTLAVGDEVVRELHFLSPEMAHANIRLTYNGIPAYENGARDSAISKKKLQDYAENLLGYRPDFIFTHVTRMVPSKGLWRDLAVMKHIDDEFRKTGETAILIVLSTEIGGPRSSDNIRHMEHWWDWPVAHREGLPDMTGGEALFYAGVQSFNTRAHNCKVLFINQFGFDRLTCGDRMSRDMEFWDIRRGSDVEFGQSIYEPFGIAQLEALSFGAICVMTNVCGCAHFVNRVAGAGGSANVIIADYTAYKARPDVIPQYLALDRDARDAVERDVAHGVAAHLLKRLPRSAEQKSIFVRRGFELASRMSWDVIARDYFLPAMREITAQRQTAGAA